jgi:hypothetical protein
LGKSWRAWRITPWMKARREGNRACKACDNYGKIGIENSFIAPLTERKCFRI